MKKRRASRYALTLCPISKHVLARHPVKGCVAMGALIGVSSVHLERAVSWVSYHFIWSHTRGEEGGVSCPYGGVHTRGGGGGLPTPYGAILGEEEGVPCPSGCLVSRWLYNMLRALTSLTSDRHVFATVGLLGIFCSAIFQEVMIIDHTYDFQNCSIIPDTISL